MSQDGGVAELVLVHGLSGSSRWWRDLVPQLRGRPARLVDIPRFGAAFRPHETVAWLGENVGPRPVVLVGHSLGGLACASLAAERPALVHGLVLVAPAGAPDHRSLRAYATGLARTVAGLQPSLFLTVVEDALRAGPEALALGARFATGATFAGEVRAPTLLVWGERDRLLPVELAAAWQHAIPGARLATIAAAGHVPMVEAPSEFAELLLEFLDGLDDRPRV